MLTFHRAVDQSTYTYATVINTDFNRHLDAYIWRKTIISDRQMQNGETDSERARDKGTTNCKCFWSAQLTFN